MATLRDLSNRMSRRANSVIELATVHVDKIVYAIANNLIDVTPVDTSKGVSNWVVTVGNKPAGDIPAHVLGKFGSTADASRAIAKQLVVQALQGYIAGQGQSIWISNVVHYIAELDDGSSFSRQEPPGFVARALLLGRVLQIGAKLGLK